jgi:PAH dioxygenase small subunit
MTTSTGTAVSAVLRLDAQDFLIAEAEVLDHRRFDEWLQLFTADATYVAPVRVTRSMSHPDVDERMSYFEENRASLGLRVRRLATDVAWAEDPPSLTRRFVTNFRCTPGPGADEVTVVDNLLLYRSRGNGGTHDLISAERRTVLRPLDGELRIAARRILLDQATLGTKNLGIFL